MPNSKSDKNSPELVRTSIFITADTDAALRALAALGKRPLSWEVRQALEAHVDANRELLTKAAA